MANKNTYMENMIEAYNEYQSGDESPEAEKEDTKLTEIFDDNLDEFEEEEAETLAYLAQGIIAAVAEGLANTDTE